MTDYTVIQIYGAEYALLSKQALNRYGIEVYTPLGKCIAPEKPSILFKEYKPAFAGYAFVQMLEGWERVLTVNHVHGVLMNDEEPVTVRPPLIEKIKKQESYGAFDERPPQKQSRRGTVIKQEEVRPVVPQAATAVKPGLTAGTQVFVTEGPFAGKEGKITRELKKGRYCIDIEGKQAKVKMDLLKYLEVLAK